MLVLAAALAINCTPAPDLEQDVRAAMELELADAQSARLHSLCSDGQAVCGLVNAKNAFGAYTGYRPFVYEVGGQLYIQPTAEDSGEDMATALIIEMTCGPIPR